MSPSGGSHQDNKRPSREERRASAGSSRPTIIEFVDSQDPNVRSAIQRHTAYHSAALRRDARSRLLQRSGGQARYFEWGRRPPRGDSDLGASSASSVSSVSISPVPSVERTASQSRASSVPRDQGSERPSAQPVAGVETQTVSVEGLTISRDGEVLNLYSDNFCQHSGSKAQLGSTITFMREDETCRHLLLAYAYATRRETLGGSATGQDQVDAQTHLGRGTNILLNRLRASSNTSSDYIIQAVLLLIAYTADFGQTSQVKLHVNAVRTMVAQRGGINAFGHNSVLQQQLWSIGSSRTHHLLFSCEAECTKALRFPAGLDLAQSSDPLLGVDGRVRS